MPGGEDEEGSEISEDFELESDAEDQGEGSGEEQVEHFTPPPARAAEPSADVDTGGDGAGEQSLDLTSAAAGQSAIEGILAAARSPKHGNLEASAEEVELGRPEGSDAAAQEIASPAGTLSDILPEASQAQEGSAPAEPTPSEPAAAAAGGAEGLSGEDFEEPSDTPRGAPGELIDDGTPRPSLSETYEPPSDTPRDGPPAALGSQSESFEPPSDTPRGGATEEPEEDAAEPLSRRDAPAIQVRVEESPVAGKAAKLGTPIGGKAPMLWSPAAGGDPRMLAPSDSGSVAASPTGTEGDSFMDGQDAEQQLLARQERAEKRRQMAEKIRLEQRAAEEAAAIKLQAVQRGRLARRRVRGMRLEGGAQDMRKSPSHRRDSNSRGTLLDPHRSPTKYSTHSPCSLRALSKDSANPAHSRKSSKNSPGEEAAVSEFLDESEEAERRELDEDVDDEEAERRRQDELQRKIARRQAAERIRMQKEDAEVAAAIKLQSMERGRQARKNMQSKREERRRQVDEEFAALQVREKQEAAAIKLQAVYRGRMARSRVNGIRMEQEQLREEERLREVAALLGASTRKEKRQVTWNEVCNPQKETLKKKLEIFEGKVAKEETLNEWRKRWAVKSKKLKNREMDKFLSLMAERGGGSVTLAWRRHFDADGDGSLSFTEFCNALVDLGYTGDVLRLWHDLIPEGETSLQLETLDQDGADILIFFGGWCQEKLGGPTEVFKAMDADGSDSLTAVEFAEGLRDLGFFEAEDLPEIICTAERVTERLFSILDVTGHGCVMAENMLFLEKDKDKKVRIKRELERIRKYGAGNSIEPLPRDAQRLLHRIGMQNTALGGRHWKLLEPGGVALGRDRPPQQKTPRSKTPRSKTPRSKTPRQPQRRAVAAKSPEAIGGATRDTARPRRKVRGSASAPALPAPAPRGGGQRRDDSPPRAAPPSTPPLTGGGAVGPMPPPQRLREAIPPVPMHLVKSAQPLRERACPKEKEELRKLQLRRKCYLQSLVPPCAALDKIASAPPQVYEMPPSFQKRQAHLEQSSFHPGHLRHFVAANKERGLWDHYQSASVPALPAGPA